ncbi:glycosyltransferase family 4 protein [Niallia sp. Krafla_26]|uniref:glycosyltransferase family 4 protein n=1 Tax=Niallia sp. Krafla_26 TaxID=3064703 RepID=UPI003D17948E
MKILHINSYYGGGMFYKHLYDRQKDQGVEIDVYVPVSNAVNLSNVNLGDYTTVSTNHSKYDRFFFHIKHHKIVKDVKNKYDIRDYDMVHAHSLFSNGYIAWKLKKEFGIPYMVAIRNTDVNYFFKYMIHLRKLGVEILKEADNIICLSESYKNTVMETCVPEHLTCEISRKVEIVPNGIDDFWFKNRSHYKESPSKDDLKLMYAGVVNKRKNVLTTTKAIELLIQRGYQVTFTVVGRMEDPTIGQTLKSMPFVQYIEPKQKEELINIYRDHDIFVMPSISETFGLVYPEAMSQGLPVIYSQGQGFDGQFDEGVVGYSVTSTSAEEVADAIEGILNNYEVLSTNCVEKVDQFHWNKISEDYFNLYTQIMEQNK